MSQFTAVMDGLHYTYNSRTRGNSKFPEVSLLNIMILYSGEKVNSLANVNDFKRTADDQELFFWTTPEI